MARTKSWEEGHKAITRDKLDKLEIKTAKHELWLTKRQADELMQVKNTFLKWYR